MERKALGKGLSALMPEKTLTQQAGGVTKLPIKDIKVSRLQPRQEKDPQKMAELIASIKEKGVIQPVLVRPGKDGYELIAGERRFRAAEKLGFTELPVIIKDVDDSEALQLALIENIQREELNPLEEAQAYQQLIDEFGLTQEKIARLVGKDSSSVSNTLRLLKLPVEIQNGLRKGMISMGHARTILALKELNLQDSFFKRTIAQRLSVRELENMVSQRAGKHRNKKLLVRDPHLTDLEQQIQFVLGTKVRIVPARKRGKIVVEYYSLSDLERLVDLLKRAK
ncbi:MAG: ParB/RepB/Spo0J family partition protein [Candidatus Omnitrophota bacterium]